MSKSKAYKPFTAAEVASVLSIKDCDELSGEQIAGDMLDGIVLFTDDELKTLATYKEVSKDQMMENDLSFKRYLDPVKKTKIMVAKNMLDKGLDVEVAAEICELEAKVVSKLRSKKEP